MLELKDKVTVTGSAGFVPEEDTGAGIAAAVTGEKEEAIAALAALGYTRNEAINAISKVKGEELTCEDYIRGALKNL